MKTLLLMTDPDRQGRKIHPNSIKALAQSRPKKSPLPAGQARQAHTLSLRNDLWNTLLTLAQSVNLSVSALAEFFGENTALLLEPITQLSDESVLERWDLLTLEQWTVLPVIQVLLRYHSHAGKKRKPPRKQQGLLRPDNAEKATHALTLSTAGWEGLNHLSDRRGLSVSGLLALIAANVELLQMPLRELPLSKRREQLGVTEVQAMQMSLLDWMQ